MVIDYNTRCHRELINIKLFAWFLLKSNPTRAQYLVPEIASCNSVMICTYTNLILDVFVNLQTLPAFFPISTCMVILYRSIMGHLWPRYKHELTVIPSWISNYMPRKVWNEITYPFLNFNGFTVEVQERISYFIPHFTMAVVTYPCWD